MAPQQFKAERAVMAMAILNIMMNNYGTYYNFSGFAAWLNTNAQDGLGVQYTGEYIRDIIEFRRPMDVNLFRDALKAAGKDWTNYQSLRDVMFSNFTGYSF